MYKTQARHLRRLLQRAGLDLIILRSRDWKCNLLQAGRCDPRMHLPMAVDLLSRVLDLPPRARIIVRQGCHQLYEKFGVWKGRTYVWPCLFDLYEWTRSTEGLNAAAREAILDRLGALLTALTPDCGAYRLAWDPTDLARFSIVFEMRGAPEFVKQIQLEPPLYSLLQHEVEKGSVNRRISLLVAFEDSQRFFNAEQHAGGAEIAPMDELASVTRGGGKGLFVVAQTMQGLSRGLIPNLATKIMGRLGSHEDYVRLGADLAMNSSQIDWARRNLKPGVFIGQVAEGDWREPFVFYAPLMKIPTDVDDREVAESVKALDVLPTVPATEFARWKPVDMISIRANATQSSCTPPLSEPELRFLRAVIENPGRPSSSYAKLARVSGKRAAEIRAKLVKAGYLREHSVAKSGRGRSAIVLEPLGPALAAVRTHQE